MTALFPLETQFSIFPTEEGYYSIIGTYVHGEDTHHFHLITFRDLDSALSFFQMGIAYCKMRQTPIPHSFLAMNNQREN